MEDTIENSAKEAYNYCTCKKDKGRKLIVYSVRMPKPLVPLFMFGNKTQTNIKEVEM